MENQGSNGLLRAFGVFGRHLPSRTCVCRVCVSGGFNKFANDFWRPRPGVDRDAAPREKRLKLVSWGVQGI